MKLYPIHREIIKTLHRQRHITVDRMTEIAKSTRHQQRVGRAMRELLDVGVLSYCGESAYTLSDCYKGKIDVR